MVWWLFFLLMGWSAVPSFLLMADRVGDLRSHEVIRRFGVPFVVVSAGLLVLAGFVEPGYLWLVGWGAVAGLLGTITLDVVRLIGLRAGAFPLDMPVVFGFMSLGKARVLQGRVMGQVLRGAVESGTIKEFVAARINRIPLLPERQRVNAAAAMMAAVATLDETTRREVSEAQVAVLASLGSSERRAVMAAMDAAAGAQHPGQPRGLPRVPFAAFREAARQAIGSLDRSDSGLMSRVRVYGYLWHAINGVSFGIGYALLFGQGSPGWAVVWGVFVWLAMMASMPLMMPVLKLPGWFPIVPLLAHIAMIVPFLALPLWVSDPAHQVSLVGWLTG